MAPEQATIAPATAQHSPPFHPGSEMAGLVARMSVQAEVYGSPIHPQDEMFRPGREQHYYGVGLDALWNVIQSMMSAGLVDPGRILDFPSGFGRVTRYLRAAFPDAQIDVGDIWEAAIVHCSATYGATRIAAKSDFRDIEAPNYNVIFCGSLLTHLPEERGIALLDFFAEHLEVGGIMIVTFCGRKNLSFEQQHFNPQAFGTPEDLDRIATTYYEGRYAFQDYPGQTGYGRSFTPVAWFQRYVQNHPQLVICRLAERSWDDNQDAATLKRVF
jgi:hypothetical protein